MSVNPTRQKVQRGPFYGMATERPGNDDIAGRKRVYHYRSGQNSRKCPQFCVNARSELALRGSLDSIFQGPSRALQIANYRCDNISNAEN